MNFVSNAGVVGFLMLMARFVSFAKKIRIKSIPAIRMTSSFYGILFSSVSIALLEKSFMLIWLTKFYLTFNASLIECY